MAYDVWGGGFRGFSATYLQIFSYILSWAVKEKKREKEKRNSGGKKVKEIGREIVFFVS